MLFVVPAWQCSQPTLGTIALREGGCERPPMMRYSILSFFFYFLAPEYEIIQEPMSQRKHE